MSLRSWLRDLRRPYRNGCQRAARAHASPGIATEPLEPRRLMSAAPTVLSVEVGSSTWERRFTTYLKAYRLGTSGFRVPDGVDQLKALPWSNLDRVTVKFSEHVNVETRDLYLSGAAVAQYPVVDMSYNPATFTATWTLGHSVSNDNVLVHIRRMTDPDGNALDGEWADGADLYPSGNGSADGVFAFRLNVLPGDVNQSGGAVNAADVGDVRARQTAQNATPYSPFCDVDGNGVIDAADLGIVRSRQRSRLPVAGSQSILPAMPTSDDWYGAVVNANTDIASAYHLNNLPPALRMITDLKGTSGLTWGRAVATVQAAHPQALIGTYHSARDAQPLATLTTHPPRAVPKEGLAESQILMKHPADPDVYIIDYSQPAARKYLVDQIVENIIRSGRPLAYLDSVSHNESGFPMPWATTMTLIRELSTNLHALGKRAIINAAWVPGITSMQSVDLVIGSGVDGVSLEMGFHPNVRGSVPRIQTAMQQYRKMLDAGLAVVFCPIATATGGDDTIENLEAEQRLHAAFGMMLRKPGDRLFVAELFWRPIPEWANWPSSFGRALGEATISTSGQGQIVMSRRFANATLTLNTATKEVTRVAVVAAAVMPEVPAAPLIRPPLSEQLFSQQPFQIAES